MFFSKTVPINVLSQIVSPDVLQYLTSYWGCNMKYSQLFEQCCVLKIKIPNFVAERGP